MLDQELLLQGLKCPTELTSGQVETFGHVIVADKFVSEEDVDEADYVIVIEGSGGGGD